MLRPWTSFFLILALPLTLPAATGLATEVPSCPDALKSYRDILACIRNNAPDVQRGRSRVEQTRAEAEASGQGINPQWSFRMVRSLPGDPAGNAFEGSLLFPWDLGEKRASLKRWNEAKLEETLASSRLKEQDILIRSYLDLIKIRQLQLKIDLLNGLMMRLQKSVTRLEKLRKPTRHQQASIEVLKSQLHAESVRAFLLILNQKTLVQGVAMRMGRKWEPDPARLPAPFTSWPEAKRFHASAIQSPSAKIAMLKSDTQILEANHARQLLKPVLNFGPDIEWTSINDDSHGFRAGLLINLPLPLVENFSGADQVRKSREQGAQLERAQTLRELESELDLQKEVYRLTIERLEGFPENLKGVRAGAEKIATLYQQGDASATALVGAVHRYLNLQEIAQQLELRAAEALCHLARASGRLEDCFP